MPAQSPGPQCHARYNGPRCLLFLTVVFFGWQNPWRFLIYPARLPVRLDKQFWLIKATVNPKRVPVGTKVSKQIHIQTDFGPFNAIINQPWPCGSRDAPAGGFQSASVGS